MTVYYLNASHLRHSLVPRGVLEAFRPTFGDCHKVFSMSEPGRITFICNPALNPPTVLLQLYKECHTASLRLRNPGFTRIALPLEFLLYMVLPTCWQGASAVAYVLYPQSQDTQATGTVRPSLIMRSYVRFPALLPWTTWQGPIH